jgi:hypothetical protein
VTIFADELNIIDPYYLDQEELMEAEATTSSEPLPDIHTTERNQYD